MESMLRQYEKGKVTAESVYQKLDKYEGEENAKDKFYLFINWASSNEQAAVEVVKSSPAQEINDFRASLNT